jgi:hypothetical protein
VLERLCNITSPNEHRSIWLALAEQIFAARQRFNVGAVFLDAASKRSLPLSEK